MLILPTGEELYSDHVEQHINAWWCSKSSEVISSNFPQLRCFRRNRFDIRKRRCDGCLEPFRLGRAMLPHDCFSNLHFFKIGRACRRRKVTRQHQHSPAVDGENFSTKTLKPSSRVIMRYGIYGMRYACLAHPAVNRDGAHFGRLGEIPMPCYEMPRKIVYDSNGRPRGFTRENTASSSCAICRPSSAWKKFSILLRARSNFAITGGRGKIRANARNMMKLDIHCSWEFIFSDRTEHPFVKGFTRKKKSEKWQIAIEFRYRLESRPSQLGWKLFFMFGK